MRLIRYIRENWRFAAAFFAAALLLSVVYRVRFFGYLAASYPGHFDLGLGEFIFRSLPGDCIAAVLLLCLSLPVLFFKTGSVYRVVLSSCILSLYAASLFSALAYFTIFEIPLNLGMLGAGLETFWKEILNSALYEVSPAQYRFLLFGVLISGLILTAALLRERGAALSRIFSVGSSAAASLWLLLALISAPGSIPKEGDMRVAGTRLEQHTLYANPAKTILGLYGSGDTVSAAQQVADSADAADFRFGLDTSSLIEKRRLPRLGVERGKKYNIVFYVFESTTTRYISMETNGQSLTPTWDRLRKNSFVSDRHYAHFPLSVNALISAFASMYNDPSQNWVVMSHPGVAVRSISEILKDAGYRNALLHSGDLNNFGHKNYLKHRDYDYMADMYTLKDNPYGTFMAHSVDDRAMIEPALDFMEASGEDPFFVALFPLAPHNPYLVPDESFEIVKGANTVSDFRQRFWLRYHNSLYYADQVLGLFIEGMRERGVLEDTLVFVFADHGEAFYQHAQNYLHALFVYEENIHVPMLIYNESLFPEAYHYEGVSRHIDLLPTALDFLGLKPDPEHEGISLISAHQQQLASLHTYWNRDFIGVRDGRWKYILDAGSGAEQLFDLDADPLEQKNVQDTYQDIASMYKKYVLQARRYKQQYYRRILTP